MAWSVDNRVSIGVVAGWVLTAAACLWSFAVKDSSLRSQVATLESRSSDFEDRLRTLERQRSELSTLTTEVRAARRDIEHLREVVVDRGSEGFDGGYGPLGVVMPQGVGGGSWFSVLPGPGARAGRSGGVRARLRADWEQKLRVLRKMLPSLFGGVDQKKAGSPTDWNAWGSGGQGKTKQKGDEK